MKLLITGRNGQVGQALVQQAAAQNFQIAAYDRDTLDITDRAAVLHTVEREQPAVIINAAAYTAVDKAESEAEATHAANATGPENLAIAAQAHGAALLHLSTDYVFNGQTPRPYRETDAPDPQTVYGKSKLAGEQAIQAACPRHLILRTAWVFGEHGDNFVKTMLRLGRERSSLGIVADQTGAPTYASDIAAALLHLAERTQTANCPYGLYHFSGSPYVSWYQFAEAIFRAAQEQHLLPNIPQLTPLTTADYPTPARHPADSRLDCGKIQHAFGLPPSNWQRALENLAPYL